MTPSSRTVRSRPGPRTGAVGGRLAELAPWAAASALLAAGGRRRGRRAALRGLAAAAAADGLVRRVRPPAGRSAPDVLLRRRADRPAQPSRRAAAAAAFAVGVVTAEPALTLPVTGFAAAVTGGRVPDARADELLAGATLGVAVALAGNRLAPARTPTPLRVVPPRHSPQPPRPDGAGVVIVVNPRSGRGRGGRLADTARRALPAAEIVPLEAGADVATAMSEAAGRAGVLGVCGGDGTVATAASAAIDAQVPLLVIPGGTFNHFAADLGVERVADAVAALRDGSAIRVDVGQVDGQLFVNTASLGSYPAFVAVRERWESRLRKPLAAAVALLVAVRREHPLRLEVDGQERLVAMMFVGNSRYQPYGFAPAWRPRLDDGRLDLRMVTVEGRLPLLRLVLSLLTGRLGRSRLYVEDDPADLLVSRPDGPGLLARDGEIGPGPATLEFTTLRRALTVYRAAPPRPFAL
jgi:undecaprenyl-diphosphatase